uniref:DUF6378 domain-containing protein n=2 Tax=unclassified bacterial viruses TaxID=12333 RepID=A0AAU8KXV4_9VIRU
MKEYLVKDPETGKYWNTFDSNERNIVYEIPEGSEVFIIFDDDIRDYCFYKENYTLGSDERDGGNWWEAEITIPAIKHRGGKIVWQRQEVFIDESEIVNGECSIKGNLSVEGTLAERQKTYGCFEDVATVTEEIIKALKIGNYDNMPNPHKMAMYMIASKMARLANGDHNHLDSWHDIGGYSKLIEKLIGGENE